ncbi:hypothetical protein [Pseudorhodoferax sp. Leaf274]|uniref:hypothetical protein n=1 Tax=Pseudorhodoferax sp. Leaf274 TaxID=1736318 RepID=UPI0007028843|nr:hypothetical protein [Pseudorhodoferax sp. Leaf274]KQP43519.1 hypothetical protein ASF44_29775 [Pseudorhodoferax sp. Leaf274]
MSTGSTDFLKHEVERHSSLAMQVNKGRRHRIVRHDLRPGSLWVTPQQDAFHVALSGAAVKGLFGPLMAEIAGRAKDGEDQDRIYWKITDTLIITRAVEAFSKVLAS